MSGKKLRIGVLISGRGSNLQALIDAARDPGYPAEIVLVVSNWAEALGLERARAAGIPTEVVDHKAAGGRARADAEMTRLLEAAGVELICLAGYMRLLTEAFVEHWRDRMINIHPSLLPAFAGLDTHERVLAAGNKLHGCTVHYVRFEMDTGPIIGQAAVPVLPGDKPEELAVRVLEAEHRLYPACLRLVAEGKVRIEGERALLDIPAGEARALVNPDPATLWP